MDSRFQKLVRDVPVVPAVTARILGMAADGQSVSFRTLEEIVKIDQGLTARILKIANSAQYARQRQVKDLRTAFTLLGFTTIRSLAVLVTASGMFRQIRSTVFYRDHWYHSVLSAFLARELAVRCRLKAVAEEAFLAALFHDIGRVPLYLADPPAYNALVRRSREEGLELRALERESLGTDHQEFGAALLEQWCFPPVYVDTAREHDAADIASPHRAVIAYVTVANVLVDRAVTGRTVQARQRLLGELLGSTCLSAGDADAVAAGLPETLKEDPLFAQCLEMYGFDAPAASAPATS